MKIGICAVACALMLSGCASLLNGPDAATLIAQDKSACVAYGFRAGTDAFAQCLQLRDVQREAKNEADRRAAGEAMQAFANGFNQRSRPVICNSNGTANDLGGGFVTGQSTTTCY